MFLVVIGKTATGYSANCPDVLGCAAVGKTVEQVVKNMKKALELHFEGIAEDGDPLPKPGGVDSYRDVMRDLDLDQCLLAHIQIDANRESWSRFIERTAGSITDPTFERQHQGELEQRETLEN